MLVATSAMFSFADALLLRPLPVLEPSKVLAVSTASTAAFATNSDISYPDYRDYRDLNHSFDGLIAAAYGSFGFSPDPISLPKIKFGRFVSGNFFTVFGVEPTLGAAFVSLKIRRSGEIPSSCLDTTLGKLVWRESFRLFQHDGYSVAAGERIPRIGSGKFSNGCRC